MYTNEVHEYSTAVHKYNRDGDGAANGVGTDAIFKLVSERRDSNGR